MSNVTYKIISKVVVNRLKEILEKSNSPFQSTFIEGRYIIDNSIVVHEILHSFKKKMKTKTEEIKLEC